MISLQNILIPTDLSEHARHATHYAVQFAKQFGSVLHMLYVIEEPVVYAPLGGYFPSREEWSAFAAAGLESWLTAEDLRDLKVTREKVIGHPVTAITSYAKENHIDMIIMGTHGRSALPNLLLGSVAENVVRYSPCPVLTVRSGQHEFVMP